MALKIKNNATSLNGQRNLETRQKKMESSLEKLASGQKIVRGADGPASLMISEQIRSYVKGVEQAIENVETGISVTQTTEAALNEVSRSLTTIRQLAVHAANQGANDDLMLQADQQELESTLDAIDNIARGTRFGKKRLLDGSTGAAGLTAHADLEFVSATPRTEGSHGDAYEVAIDRTATRAVFVADDALTLDRIRDGAGDRLVLKIMENGKQAIYVVKAEDTPESVLQNLRRAVREANLDVDVGMDDGHLMVIHKEFGTRATFQVYSSQAGILSDAAGEVSSAIRGRDVAGTINGEPAVGRGRELTGVAGNPTTSGLTVRYVGNSDDMEGETGVDAGEVYVSQNSMKFQIGPGVGETAEVGFRGVFTHALGKGVHNESGFRSLKDLDLTTAQGAEDALRVTEKAIGEVAGFRGDVGAVQKNLLESGLESMRVAKENMVAADSTIRDVDYASEYSEYIKNKLMVETTVSLLADANQVNESVLTLINRK